MRIRPIWAFPLAAVATTGILFTANAVTGSAEPGPSAPAPITLADDGKDTTAEPKAKPTGLSVRNDPILGKTVVDAKGWTLYRFDKDTADPSVSNCAGDCAKAWPPVASSEDVQVKGISKELVGTVTRDDGTEQVTLGGWPLYRYAKDTEPGDTNGQGVGGTWFASDPAGKKAQPAADVQEPAAVPTPAPQQPQQPAVPRNNGWKGWTVLKAVDNAALGKIVVDGKGWTLYRFDKDTVQPSISNCLGACATAWPPVKFNGKLKLDGVPKSLIGNIMRKDGICQVTLAGWPLYRYAKDTKPGDTKGQGVGGTWFVSTPEGKKAKAAATEETAPQQPDDPYSY